MGGNFPEVKFGKEMCNKNKIQTGLMKKKRKVTTPIEAYFCYLKREAGELPLDTDCTWRRGQSARQPCSCLGQHYSAGSTQEYGQVSIY